MMYWFRGMRRLRAEIAPVDSHATSQAVGVDVYMGKAGCDGGCTDSNCGVQGLTTGIHIFFSFSFCSSNLILVVAKI